MTLESETTVWHHRETSVSDTESDARGHFREHSREHSWKHSWEYSESTQRALRDDVRAHPSPLDEQNAILNLSLKHLSVPTNHIKVYFYPEIDIMPSLHLYLFTLSAQDEVHNDEGIWVLFLMRIGVEKKVRIGVVCNENWCCKVSKGANWWRHTWSVRRDFPPQEQL